MGKKMMKLPYLFKNKEETTRSPLSSSWQWPSCKQPKTHSFRGAGDDIFKTVNSVYFDGGGEIIMNTPESWFTNSSESGSFSTASEESGEESLEMVIRGLRSERLFFEPGHTNSILEEAKAGGFRFKESVVMAMDSEDPYVDFRNSMEEMVEAHGLKEWNCLEELLSWYLKVNGKKNHGYIVGAFVDLLVTLAAADAASVAQDNSTSSSSSSSSSSPSLSSLLQDPDEEIEKVSSLEISEI